jgi:imidazolonepropionase-like amidohydrolase
VILNGNPLQDISNTKNIHAVIINGKMYNRKVLEAMKEEVTKMNANYK